MKISFYGSAAGLGRIMICKELEEDLISITQLLRNGVSVILSTVTNPVATITTLDNKIITVQLNSDEQFQVPHDVLLQLIQNPQDGRAYNSMASLTTDDSDDEDEEQILYDNDASTTGVAEVTGPQTVAQVTYTAEQRARAEQVRRIHEQLHCSDEALKTVLNNGLIIGRGLTAKDVDVSRDIFGLCFACMAGKVTKPSYKHDSVAPPATCVGQTVHADLLVYEHPIIGGYMQQLFSVDEFSGNKHITSIKCKSITYLRMAFCDLISYYATHG
jgi:hypothetical protein